jgi:hypothetical protein
MQKQCLVKELTAGFEYPTVDPDTTDDARCTRLWLMVDL